MLTLVRVIEALMVFGLTYCFCDQVAHIANPDNTWTKKAIRNVRRRLRKPMH